jgi:deoxyribonuclease-4
MQPPPLGAHVSIAGGMPNAIQRGVDLGCSTIQVFVKNPSQWRARPLDRQEVASFRQAHRASPIGPLVAHSTYLINLASSDPSKLRPSRQTVADELDRCARLGIGALVLHPGAHLGQGEEIGLARIARSLDAVLRRRPRCRVRVLLENTAGQGTLVGYRLEQLHAIWLACDGCKRIGLCLDTCHAFAAGYPIHEESGLEELLGQVDELFGPSALGCLHLNDSRGNQGSRRDRHANIGQGEIGLDAFTHLLYHPRLRSVPMILETPLGDDKQGHRRDLELLRSL